MAKIVLVTGGARSGKSRFTEELLLSKTDVCYIATGIGQLEDAEWQERVRLHRERRPQDWRTEERYSKIGEWILQQGVKQTYLLDCATMLITNVLFETIGELFPDKMMLEDDHFLTKVEEKLLTKKIEEEWKHLLSAIRDRDSELYIVTNEIGLGVVPDNKLGRYFRDLLGNINQMLAKEASEVYLVICGISQRLK